MEMQSIPMPSSQNIPLKFRDWIDQDKLDRRFLNFNSNAIYFLEKNKNKVLPYILTENTNPYAMNILKEQLNNMDDITLCDLFRNPNAISIIENNKEKLQSINCLWNALSINSNAMHILKENPDILEWLLNGEDK